MTNQYLKPNRKALKKIKHIVVLMMENRSFDNMLGWLYDEQKPPHDQYFEGLRDNYWNPLNNIDSDGMPFIEQVYVRKNGEAPRYGPRKLKEKKYDEDFCFPNPDPGEGFRDTNHQLFQHYEIGQLYPPTPVNTGFVNNYANAMLYGAYSFGDTPTDPRNIMACYTPEQTPVLSTLAKKFAVCDHWHCSVPSQTLPNRDFVHAATSTGFVNNKPTAQCDAKTIYQLIQDEIDGGRKELSWMVYGGEKDGKPFSLTQTIMTQLHDPKFKKNFQPISKFIKACKSGKLPSYSFLEPQFSGPLQNDQHPSQDIRPGEHLMAKVYNAIIKSPAWKETLFVITYDEHGGCYDHVAPGNAEPPDGYPGKPGQDGFLFNRFGVRVPAVVISPWVKAGTIGRPSGYVPFDHTSIIATVRHCFDLPGYLTMRDKHAPDLSCLLTLKRARRDFPKVTPLPLPKGLKDPQQDNDLQTNAAEVLEKVSGIKRNKNEMLHDYLHRAYHRHFTKR
ncbi:alkaline phosphatase family protein [Aliikangiella coralliicola]|uniref:Phosphoesterase n=1 Tax=Aliikangiella coralliicola TaxID=2592383 RepID=A0A545UEU4_9GAMM|nr:alkaline phosphatase family protein [Aliikangiella coralliicola]TQV87978.1 phosphoesterase [Aliikangiella coralliicola]